MAKGRVATPNLFENFKIPEIKEDISAKEEGSAYDELPEHEEDEAMPGINPTISAMIKSRPKQKKKKDTRSFYIADELYEKLEFLARDNGMNTSEVLTMILEEYL